MLIYTKETLEEYAQKSLYLTDMVRKIYGNNYSGSQHQNIKKRIKDYNIDISHWLSRKEICNISRKKTSTNILIKSNILRKGNDLRTSLLSSGIKKECSICKIHTWNKKELTLHVDHIDGDKLNNEISNLRLLCPNCHSQTENFGAKNRKDLIKHKKCEVCAILIHKTSTRCSSCAKIKTRTPPNKEDLINEIQNQTMVDIGKKYKVSPKVVRSWCKKYEIFDLRKRKQFEK
jgi:hypothetical protein